MTDIEAARKVIAEARERHREVTASLLAFPALTAAERKALVVVADVPALCDGWEAALARVAELEEEIRQRCRNRGVTDAEYKWLRNES